MRPLAAGFGERTPPGSLAVTLQHVPLGRIELPGEHVRAGEHIRLELGQDRGQFVQDLTFGSLGDREFGHEPAGDRIEAPRPRLLAVLVREERQ